MQPDEMASAPAQGRAMLESSHLRAGAQKRSRSAHLPQPRTSLLRGTPAHAGSH